MDASAWDAAATPSIRRSIWRAPASTSPTAPPQLLQLGQLHGLYLMETDNKGERRFTYWRENAPARELFELPQWGQVADAMLSARLIYFSGITLSLYSNNGLGRFLAIL